MLRALLRRVKLLIRTAMGREIIVRPEIECVTERFGSDYGGWTVAVSGLSRDSVVYSFGIGEDISFDVALIERFGIAVHGFDPTPRSVEWVRRQNPPQEFVLHEYGIADFDGKAAFNPPVNRNHVSHTIIDRPETSNDSIELPVKRLQTIASELDHSRIDILKMDIEGAEYVVIDDIERGAIRPTQILVEFHHRFRELGVEKSLRAIEQIRSMGYRLFFVSATNEEYCFIR